MAKKQTFDEKLAEADSMVELACRVRDYAERTDGQWDADVLYLSDEILNYIFELISENPEKFVNPKLDELTDWLEKYPPPSGDNLSKLKDSLSFTIWNEELERVLNQLKHQREFKDMMLSVEYNLDNHIQEVQEPTLAELFSRARDLVAQAREERGEYLATKKMFEDKYGDEEERATKRLIDNDFYNMENRLLGISYDETYGFAKDAYNNLLRSHPDNLTAKAECLSLHFEIGDLSMEDMTSFFEVDLYVPEDILDERNKMVNDINSLKDRFNAIEDDEQRKLSALYLIMAKQELVLN